MTKVYVGMSGGVDSSLAAALLQEQGYDVTGVYMKNWTLDLPGMVCPWAEDLADAKRVAVGLGIDFQVFDFESQYKQKVVDYMIQEYRSGRTPNPDIMCNQEVKFKLFLEVAMERGADYIATGHYAISMGGQLKRAVDENKDQTYFLYRVSESALEKTIFPLGGYKKDEVRQMARMRHLWTADKKDSQGICFIGQVGIKDFLSQYVDSQPGAIIDKSTGQTIGEHDGAIFYTIGQRHGLNLGGGLPYYVAGKDMDANIVYVTRDLNDAELWRDRVNLGDVHWINRQPDPGRYLARVRHRAPLVEAELRLSDANQNTVEVRFAESLRALAPGQSVVLYEGETVLGGGVIC